MLTFVWEASKLQDRRSHTQILPCIPEVGPRTNGDLLTQPPGCRYLQQPSWLSKRHAKHVSLRDLTQVHLLFEL